MHNAYAFSSLLLNFYFFFFFFEIAGSRISQLCNAFNINICNTIANYGLERKTAKKQKMTNRILELSHVATFVYMAFIK